MSLLCDRKTTTNSLDQRNYMYSSYRHRDIRWYSLKFMICFHLDESLGKEAAHNPVAKGISRSVHIYWRLRKEENRKPVPKTGRRRKRAYEENNERWKEIDGWMTSEVNTHTHISKIIEKKDREERLLLNVINFQIVADKTGDYRALPWFAQELTKRQRRGKSHYCETVSPLKRRVPCYIRRQLSGKQMVFLGPLLLNHYTTKNNFRTSYKVINRLLRQSCNGFNWK